jgi:transposase-like protein
MHSKAATRRRHGAEVKAKVLAECDEPGASVAAVAQSHGLNANLVHKWRRECRQRVPAIEVTPADGKAAGAFVVLRIAGSRRGPRCRLISARESCCCLQAI